LGLASRRYDALLPGLLHKNTGDVLWATLVFLLFRLLLPRQSGLQVALAAGAFCLAIEFGKLYHAPWLDSLRDTTPGRLVFGYVFSWSNLLCYLIGIGIGILLERTLWRLQGQKYSGQRPGVEGL
jgi:hypothetical protein